MLASSEKQMGKCVNCNMIVGTWHVTGDIEGRLTLQPHRRQLKVQSSNEVIAPLESIIECRLSPQSLPLGR